MLVVGTPPELTDAADLARRMRTWPVGSELRRTDEVLPDLWLLDGDVVGVRASGPQGMRLCFSRDRTHVAVMTAVFEQWWAGAERVAVSERVRWDETEAYYDCDLD